MNDSNDSRETLLSLWRKLKPRRFEPESAGYNEIEALLTHGPSGARFGPPRPDPPGPARPHPTPPGPTQPRAAPPGPTQPRPAPAGRIPQQPSAPPIDLLRDSEETSARNRGRHVEPERNSNAEASSQRRPSAIDAPATECCICMDKPPDTALIPCGHFVCDDCVKNLRTCPICRKDVQSSIRTYR